MDVAAQEKREKLIDNYNKKMEKQTIDQRRQSAEKVQEFFSVMKGADVDKLIIEGILNK